MKFCPRKTRPIYNKKTFLKTGKVKDDDSNTNKFELNDDTVMLNNVNLLTFEE